MLHGIAAYFGQFELKEQEMLLQTREIILQTHPAIHEKFTYQSPFYAYRKILCYLVYNKKNRRFVIGLIQGSRIEDVFGLLKHEDGQKDIRHLVLDLRDPIGPEVIRTYVLLSMEVQDQDTLIK